MSLRSAGHHFEHCRLARSAVRPVHAMAGEWYSECSSAYKTSAGSCLDPDTGEKVDSEMARASVFECAGMRASCSECGHAILCGVLHSGSCKQDSVGETDEKKSIREPSVRSCLDATN